MAKVMTLWFTIATAVSLWPGPGLAARIIPLGQRPGRIGSSSGTPAPTTSAHVSSSEDSRIWHALCTALFFMRIREIWRTSELRGGCYSHGWTKIAILFLSVPLLIVGGYVASAGKGISLGLTGAPAAPPDGSPEPSAARDEPNDNSPAEPDQRVEEPREAYYMLGFDAAGGAAQPPHTFAT